MNDQRIETERLGRIRGGTPLSGLARSAVERASVSDPPPIF